MDSRSARGATGRSAFTLLAKVACALVLAGMAVVSTGCHELYCNFVEGLTGDPLDCSHDGFPELGDVTFPDLPPPPALPGRTATITWSEPVVAGQPETFTAAAVYDPDDHPLRYRWDLDGDGTFNDHVGVGEDGHRATRTFNAPGSHTVKVEVAPAADEHPDASDISKGTVVFTVAGGTGPRAPNPLEVEIELGSVSSPPQGPRARIKATVSQDGSGADGATVGFDFESDGTVDEERTSDAEGHATADHQYANGDHKVTVTARRGEEAGSASREFTYTDGEINFPKRAVAAKAKGRRFTARFGMAELRRGKRVKRKRTISIRRQLSIGALAGRVKGKTPASLKGFLLSTWITRSTLTYNRKRRRSKVSGVAVATFLKRPGQACVRYSVTARARRRYGKGRLTLLGGTGAAARTRAVANVRVTARKGRFVLKGRITTRRVKRRGLNKACRNLIATVRKLPG